LDIKQRAACARALLADDNFRTVMDELKEEQVNIFLNSKSADSEMREEAHSIVSALSKIEARLQSAITDEKIFDKRK
jgi:phosphomevalonate kinase